ncbi:hypothetical protein B0H14DRAFT_2597441, partial [Mycena olivaceomarginata]
SSSGNVDRGSESLKECMNVVLEVDRKRRLRDGVPKVCSAILRSRRRRKVSTNSWRDDKGGLGDEGEGRGTIGDVVPFREVSRVATMGWRTRACAEQIKNIVRKKRTQGKQCKEKRRE